MILEALGQGASVAAGGESIAEDWWSTAQNVGQVIVTLAIPLGAALLAIRKWGSSKAKNWVRSAVGVEDGDEVADVAIQVEELARENQVIATDVRDELRDLRTENTAQHQENAEAMRSFRVENTESHRRLHERIDQSQSELADHITRHDTTATNIDAKVDRVERALDRLIDSLIRRNGSN